MARGSALGLASLDVEATGRRRGREGGAGGRKHVPGRGGAGAGQAAAGAGVVRAVGWGGRGRNGPWFWCGDLQWLAHATDRRASRELRGGTRRARLRAALCRGQGAVAALDRARKAAAGAGVHCGRGYRACCWSRGPGRRRARAAGSQSSALPQTSPTGCRPGAPPRCWAHWRAAPTTPQTGSLHGCSASKVPV